LKPAGARLAALLIGALVCAGARPATAAWIEYLTIEANEGGSSGGHAALRFGERTYHFQNERGRLRLVREDTRRLFHDYVLTGNRGVHASRIEMSDETWHRLREQFETRLFVQTRQLALADSLTRERALLAQLARRVGAIEVAIPGAAYVEPAPPAEASSALAALRDRVERERGPDFLAERRRVIRARLRALDPSATPDPPADASLEVAPPPLSTFAERYVELASALTALGWIEDGARLRSGSTRVLADDALRIGVGERRALERAAKDLDARLLGLTTSRTLDGGYALLVGLARRAAMERSLGSGHLVVLDAYAPDAKRIERKSGLLRPRHLEPLLQDARADLARARERLVEAEAPGERELAALEDVANRYAEVSRAARDGRALRVQRGRLAPTRTAALPLPRPQVTDTDLESALARAAERERSWLRALDRIHRYHLLSNNCVSAIFETLNAAFDDPEAESTEQLGGYVDPAGPLRFWPLVSATVVRDAYRVGGEWRLPSLRRSRMAAMRSEEGDLRVALRESNTLTARAYTRNPADSFFLFFTDAPRAAPLRPLLGAINLGASLAQTAWGIPWVPLDEGRRLVSGLRGILMSGSELGFVNIRKGTNPTVSRDQRAGLDELLASQGPAKRTTSPR
jgi:hypothetical protein